MSQAQSMQIFVNGEPLHTQNGLSVSGLLDQLDIASDRVAVELNKILVRKRDWPETIVTPGAHLEVVEFVGGG